MRNSLAAGSNSGERPSGDKKPRRSVYRRCRGYHKIVRVWAGGETCFSRAAIGRSENARARNVRDRIGRSETEKVALREPQLGSQRGEPSGISWISRAALRAGRALPRETQLRDAMRFDVLGEGSLTRSAQRLLFQNRVIIENRSCTRRTSRGRLSDGSTILLIWIIDYAKPVPMRRRQMRDWRSNVFTIIFFSTESFCVGVVGNFLLSFYIDTYFFLPTIRFFSIERFCVGVVSNFLSSFYVDTSFFFAGEQRGRC